MSGNDQCTGGSGGTASRRELELKLAKTRAAAEEARLRAEAAALEMELASLEEAEAEPPAVAVEKEPEAQPLSAAVAKKDVEPEPSAVAVVKEDDKAESAPAVVARKDVEPKPRSTATAEKDDDKEDENPPGAYVPRSALARWFQDSSGWMVSALIHMAIVVVLGILSVGLSEDGLPGIFLDASADVEDADTLEDMTSEFASEDLKIEDVETLPTNLAEIGMAAIGDMVGVTEIHEMGNTSISDATDPMADLGALFGDDGQGMADRGEGKGGAMFFGVKASGNKFIFIVDGSKSMDKNGWEFCKQELICSVRRLKPDQWFYVILFAAQPNMMYGPQDRESMPVQATPENISRLERWLARYELQLGTKPLDSMKKALDMNPDAIYFLTDGKIQDDTEGHLKRNNKKDDLYDGPKTRVSVHTIGFFTLDGAEVLKRISQENSGTFRYVAKPPGYEKFRQQQKKMAARPGKR